MTQELIYTSVPRGLKPGSKGFCTVAQSADLSAQWVERLESLSGYRPVFPLGDPSAAKNPVIWAHWRASVVGRTRSILSRVAFAGVDYSQRSNKFAHHLVLEPGEQAAGGPAWVMLQPGVMERQWSREPGLLPAGRALPQADRPRRPCSAWAAATGDAGWGGVLAEAFLDAPSKAAYLIFEPGLDVLSLIDEALGLLPPDKRWQVTFSTYFTELPAGLTCAWRAVVPGTAGAKEALRAAGTALVIDLTRQLGAPQSALADAARNGTVPPIVSPRAGDVQSPVGGHQTGTVSHEVSEPSRGRAIGSRRRLGGGEDLEMAEDPIDPDQQLVARKNISAGAAFDRGIAGRAVAIIAVGCATAAAVSAVFWWGLTRHGWIGDRGNHAAGPVVSAPAIVKEPSTTPVVLTVTSPAAGPAIIMSPSSQTLMDGQEVTFTATASGTPTPTVQWMVQTSGGSTFVPIKGETSNTLSLGAARLAETGNLYEAVFHNGSGPDASTTPVVLTVTSPAAGPAIIMSPSSQTLMDGQEVTFTATASGTPTPTVQWMVQTSGGSTFVPIKGETSNTLSLGAARLAETGNLYEAVFHNGSGPDAITTPAVLTITPTPVYSLEDLLPANPFSPPDSTTAVTAIRFPSGEEKFHLGTEDKSLSFDPPTCTLKLEYPGTRRSVATLLTQHGKVVFQWSGDAEKIASLNEIKDVLLCSCIEIRDGGKTQPDAHDVRFTKKMNQKLELLPGSSCIAAIPLSCVPYAKFRTTGGPKEWACQPAEHSDSLVYRRSFTIDGAVRPVDFSITRADLRSAKDEKIPAGAKISWEWGSAYKQLRDELTAAGNEAIATKQELGELNKEKKSSKSGKDLGRRIQEAKNANEQAKRKRDKLQEIVKQCDGLGGWAVQVVLDNDFVAATINVPAAADTPPAAGSDGD